MLSCENHHPLSNGTLDGLKTVSRAILDRTFSTNSNMLTSARAGGLIICFIQIEIAVYHSPNALE